MTQLLQLKKVKKGEITMSEKDKNTIIIAAIALLIFGLCFLGIRPAFTGLQEARAKNAELSATKKEMQTEINSLPTYKTNLENAKKEYASTSARVYGDLTNDKIHDEVVEFISSCGLQTTSFSVNNVSTASVSQYAVTDGAGSGGVSDGTVKLADINVSVFGSKDQIVSFVDKLNTTEGTFLQQVSFADSGENTTVSAVFTMVLSDTFA